MPSDRPRLSGNIDEDTHDQWREFADYHGVDVSSLLEAIGRALPTPGTRLPNWWRRIILTARTVRAERKDRRPLD